MERMSSASGGEGGRVRRWMEGRKEEETKKKKGAVEDSQGSLPTGSAAGKGQPRRRRRGVAAEGSRGGRRRTAAEGSLAVGRDGGGERGEGRRGWWWWLAACFQRRSPPLPKRRPRAMNGSAPGRGVGGRAPRWPRRQPPSVGPAACAGPPAEAPRPTAGPMVGRHVGGQGGDAVVCGGPGHSLKGGGGVEGSRGRAGGGKILVSGCDKGESGHDHSACVVHWRVCRRLHHVWHM